MGYTPRKLGHVNIFVRNAERPGIGMRTSSVCIPTGLRPDAPPS